MGSNGAIVTGTTRISIEWTPGERVPGWLSRSGDGDARGVLVAHGAGAGQDHPFMKRLRAALADAGVTVLGFDYPYMAAGRKAPDRMPKLMECHRAALERLRGETTGAPVLVGKSMGGRVGGHLAAETPVTGVAFLGYPLVGIGKSEPRPVDHLRSVGAPMLVLQGERDRLGSPAQVAQAMRGIPGVEVAEIPDADHSFNAPKRAGDRVGPMLERLVAWIGAL